MRLVCYGSDLPVELDDITEAWVAGVACRLGYTKGRFAVLTCELLDEGRCAVHAINLHYPPTIYSDGHDHCILTRRFVVDLMPPPETLPYFHPEESP